MTSRKTLILIASAGSAAMLLGAWGFQYIGGMAPCKLCYWQRYPHAAAFVIGVLAYFLPGRWLPMLALATAVPLLGFLGIEVGLGLYLPD